MSFARLSDSNQSFPAKWKEGQCTDIVLLLPVAQFCLMMSVVACLEAATQGGTVLYIDTERKFSSKRQVACSRTDSKLEGGWAR